MTDPQARAKRIHDLLAGKGNILGTGNEIVIVQSPEAAGDVGTVHHVTHEISSTTYVDSAGHLHAVLIDDVTVGGSTTMEILSDVVVTPPPG
jgi:hypothetical protein